MPKNRKLQQKREISSLPKERKFNLNNNELKGEEERELNDFVNEISQIKSLLSRLECSSHFWEINKKQEEEIPKRRLSILNQMSSCSNNKLISSNNNSGILLNSDLPIMEEQLNNIKQSLEQFKQFRINQPTKEYFYKNERIGGYNLKKEKELIMPSQIRTRLLNMEFHIEKRIRDLLDEKRNIKKTINLSNNSSLFDNYIPSIILEKNENLLLNTQQEQQKDLNKKDFTNNNILSPINYDKLLLTPNKEQIIIKDYFDNLNIKKEKEEQIFEPINQFVSSSSIENSKQEEKNINITQIIEKREEQQQPSINHTQEQINFEKMLQVLKKPNNFDISSSNSSADEIEKLTNLGIKSLETEQKQLFNNNNLINIPTKLKTIEEKTNLLKQNNESDSDSDFFK